MSNPKELYASRIAILTVQIEKLTRQVRWFGTFRLLSFLAFPTALIGLHFSILAFIFSIIFLILFLYTVKRHLNLQQQKKHQQILLDFYKDELETLQQWNFSRFDDGKKFEKANHPYAKDLLLFGKHSIFQMISRTHPFLGQAFLAQEMTHFYTSAKDIKQQQEAVKEVSKCIGFKEHFLIHSREHQITAKQLTALYKWFHKNFTSHQINQLRIVGIIQPLIFTATLVLILMGVWSINFLLLPFFSMGLLLWPYFKRLNRLMSESDGVAPLLQQFMHIFQDIESRNFQSALLVEKQGLLKKTTFASSEIKRLFKAFKRLEFRLNLLVGIILNITCLWDAWCLYSIENINERFKHHFEDWLDTVRFFDAMISKGQFALNHANAIFPTVKEEGQISFNMVCAKHPLIAPEKSIGNDFNIEENGELKLITGANMAGKSTFLRTVGVNHILASIGLPVFCNAMTFKPMQLFTSMLTVDDLSEERSYFLAEVERLAKMVAHIGEKPDTLLIMDEILKGTNSHDKEEGSRRFIQKLISMNATGIIATHDLNLTHMETEYPSKIENLSFEVEHVGDQMQFDYTLRKGATQNMNAMQLLFNKGLIASKD